MKTLAQLSIHHKGGAGGGGPAPSTVAAAPPPPTQQSVEVQQAQREAAKQAAKKRGYQSTILAGETGGYQPPAGPTLMAGQAAQAGQTKTTLLGGG